MNKKEPQKTAFSKQEHALVLRYFILYLFLFVIFIAIITYLLDRNELNQQKHVFQIHEDREIDIPATAMAGTLRILISDLLIISEKNEIQNILSNDSQQNREALGWEFLSQMRRKKAYMEICLIDLQGHELVKTVAGNNEPILVPPNLRMMRNDPVTLSALKKLHASSLFLSPIEPVKNESGNLDYLGSSLHLGKLVYDRIGRKQAVLLIQCYLEHVLEEFKRLSSNTMGDMFLLDNMGRLIMDTRAREPKSIMNADEFTAKYRSEWRRINKEDAGQFITDNGIFTFRTIFPLQEFHGLKFSSVENENPLVLEEDKAAFSIKIVSIISRSQLRELVNRFSQRILILDILVLIPLAARSWLFARTRVMRQKAEDALRESEARYSMVVENAKDGVIIIQKGIIIFANKAMEVITGYGNDEIIGITSTKLISPECQNVLEDMQMKDICLHGLAPIYEARICGKNDITRDVEISSDVVTMKGENVTIAIIRDITDRKRAEEEVKKLRDEFIYTLVHDLKGPLTSINAYLKLISDPRFGEISDRKIGFIDLIKSSLDILLSMINNITNASRLEEGKMDYNIDDWKLAELFDELYKTFEALALISSITLTFDCDSELWVHGDREKIREVFHNLISNAFRYTSKNGIITITVQEREKDCEVRVSDTGQGIPEAEMGNLFKKFSQVKGERRGSGLGLYIVKSIIEAHGSHISAESTLGKGTTFIFTIPKSTSRKPTDVTLQKIMLVCDDEGATALLSGAMKSDGFPVIQENSGKAALLKIPDEKPALIVLYQQIAETDIITFGKEYRKNSSGSAAPILLIASGNDSRWEGLFSRIVPLPLNMTHFRETQRELLGIEVSIRSL